MNIRLAASSIVSLLAIAIGLAACKDEGIETSQYVDSLPTTVCEAVIACSCEYPNGALYDHCVAQLGVAASTLAEINAVDGLKFDGVCAEKEIDAVGSLGCGVAVPDPDAECKAPCKVWHGPMGTGGTCTSINGYDNCKQGLSCIEGVCIHPCDEPNLPDVGQPCAPAYGCDEGAYCDAETAPLFPKCAALPGVGAPCILPNYLCAETLTCDTSDPDDPVCAALPGAGDECPQGVCAADLYCDSTEAPAVCAALPTLGEDCDLGFCEAPYPCIDGECVPPNPAVCGNYGGLPEDDEGPGTFDPDSGVSVGEVDTGFDTGADGGLDSGTTGGPDLGDCCTPHDTPACTGVEVAACVCAQDELCCIDPWSEVCVSEVVSFGCGVC